MCGYAGVSVKTGDNDNTTLYGLCDIGISTDPNGKGHNSTMTGAGKSESGPNIIFSSKPGPIFVASNTKVVAGVSFSYIVCRDIVPTISASGHPGDGQSS